MRFIILIGPTRAGKSTYAAELSANVDNSLIVSSDKIRELHGYGHSKEEHIKVFDELLKTCRNNYDKNIIVDATNMGLRHRRSLYNSFKKRYTFECHILITAFHVLVTRSSNRNLVIHQLKQFTVPKIGTDCDKIEVIRRAQDEDPLKDIIDEHMFHSTPHHLETVHRHIEMCIENSGSSYLKDFARFHDIGKYLTKSGGKYFNHANVSAYITLTAGYDINFAADIGAHMDDNHWFRPIDSESRVEFPIFDVVKQGPYTKWNITREVGRMKALIAKYQDSYFDECVDILKYRSAVYNQYGQLVQVGFPKFFNCNEFDSELCKPKGKLRYFNKYDGSLILVTKLSNGELMINSRGSLQENEYVKKWKSVADPEMEYKPDTTYLFELFGTENRIVVNYNFPLKTILLATVDHKTMTLNMCNEISHSEAEDILASTNTEGVVIQDERGMLFKIKTKEYLEKHNSTSITANVDNIAKLIHDNTIDDILSHRDDIKAIYEKYITVSAELEAKTKELYSQHESKKHFFQAKYEGIYYFMYPYAVENKDKGMKYIKSILKYVMKS